VHVFAAASHSSFTPLVQVAFPQVQGTVVITALPSVVLQTAPVGAGVGSDVGDSVGTCVVASHPFTCVVLHPDIEVAIDSSQDFFK
jgi:hypothetical protein